MSRIQTMKFRTFISIFLLCGIGMYFPSAAAGGQVQDVPQRMKPGFMSISPADMTTYLEFLAADELEGRDTPSKGQTIARRYIQSLYQTWSILPLGDGAGAKRSYEQRVPMIIKTFGGGTALELASSTTVRKFAAEQDFSFVMGVDFAGTIEGPVVFGGHGVSAPDLGYDDFSAIDVRDKIVLIAAGRPGGQRPDSPFNSAEHWARFEGRRTPAENCARLLAGKGAAALLVADDSMDRYVSPHGYRRDARIMSSSNRVFSPPLAVADLMVPTFWVSTRIAEAAFQAISRNYAETVRRIDSDLRPNSFGLPGLKIRLNVDMEQRASACGNLLGMIGGSDPELRKEYVVVGAHLDHVGINKDGYVFNGADDNASGSVGVLQIARALALNPEKPRRSVVFAHWTGEEKGLVGSRYFLEFPAIPLKDVVAYINLDMISHDCPLDEAREEARMFHLTDEEIAKIPDEPKKLLRAYVSLPSPDFASLIVRTNKDYVGLEVIPLLSFPMLGNSDHYFFALKKIPSVFFFTGGNEHAHTPLDTVERINAEKMADVVKLAYALAFSTADETQRPLWKE